MIIKNTLLLGGKEYTLIPNDGATNQYEYSSGSSCMVYRAIDSNQRIVLIKEYLESTSFEKYGDVEKQARETHNIITEVISAYKENNAKYHPIDIEIVIDSKKTVYQIFRDADGKSLNAEFLIPKFHQNNSNEILQKYLGFLKGLNCIHSKGILHNDIKPENIVCIIGNPGEEFYQPIDFASAVRIAVPHSLYYTDSTENWYCQNDIYKLETMRLIESPDYEKFVFSLDCSAAARVLFYMLTGGNRKFSTMQEEIEQMLWNIQLNEKRLVDDAPESFKHLVNFFAKAFDSNIESRYLSCTEMIEDLQTVLWSLSEDNCKKSIRAQKIAMLNRLKTNIKLQKQYEKYENTNPEILPYIKMGDCEFTFSKLLDEHLDKNLFLTGVAGAGKSSSLIWYYVNSLKSNDDKMVFYIPLKKLSLEDFKYKIGRLTERVVRKGKVIVLLDALDESDIKDNEFKDFVDNLKNYQYVVTSRYNPIEKEKLLRKKQKLEKLPSERFEYGFFEPLAEDKVFNYTNTNKDVFESSPQLLELIQNPMLLTIFWDIAQKQEMESLRTLTNEEEMIKIYIENMYAKKDKGKYFEDDQYEKCLDEIGLYALQQLKIKMEGRKKYFDRLSTIVSYQEQPDGTLSFSFSHQMFEDYFKARAYHKKLKEEILKTDNSFSAKSKTLKELYFKTPYIGGRSKKAAEEADDKYSYQMLLFVAQMLSRENTTTENACFEKHLESTCKKLHNTIRLRNWIFKGIKFLIVFATLPFTYTPFWLTLETNVVGLSRLLCVILCFFPTFHLDDHFYAFFQDAFWIQSLKLNSTAERFDDFNGLKGLNYTSKKKGTNPLTSIYIPKYVSSPETTMYNVSKFKVSPQNKYYTETDDGCGLLRKRDNCCTFVGKTSKLFCSTTKKINLFYSRELEELEEINLPNVKRICTDDFAEFEKLNSIKLQNCATISKCAFCQCYSLKKIEIPSIKRINKYAFGDCRSIEEIDLHNIEKIGKYAFVNCSSLTTLHLSANCKFISKSAFGNCMNLKTIIFDGTQKQWLKISRNNHKLGAKICQIHCHDGKITYVGKLEKVVARKFPKHLWWKSEEVDELILLGSKKGFKIYKYIVISYSFLHDEVQQGRGISFSDFKNLKKLIINATSFNCERLVLSSGEVLETNHFWIPDSVETLELTNAKVFPKDVCLYGLKNFSAPALNEIEADVFSKIECLHIPSVKKIFKDTFRYCSSLKEISLPLVQEIGDFAFYTCSSLKEISLPLVQKIGNHTFGDCFSLKEIFLPSVQEIGDFAFSDCASITTISFSKAIQKIGQAPFLNCKKLEKIIYGGSKAEWKRLCENTQELGVYHSIVVRCSDGELLPDKTSPAFIKDLLDLLSDDFNDLIGNIDEDSLFDFDDFFKHPKDTK